MAAIGAQPSWVETAIADSAKQEAQQSPEWVSKGKAGEPVEFGVKVCILEDQHRFILHHHVMEKQTDDQVAVLMVTQAKNIHRIGAILWEQNQQQALRKSSRAKHAPPDKQAA